MWQTAATATLLMLAIPVRECLQQLLADSSYCYTVDADNSSKRKCLHHEAAVKAMQEYESSEHLSKLAAACAHSLPTVTVTTSHSNNGNGNSLCH